MLFSPGGEGAPHVCRTNPFACHNLSLATPVIPLASPACNTTRTQDSLQPQTNHLALLSSLPTTLPNPTGRAGHSAKNRDAQLTELAPRVAPKVESHTGNTNPNQFF